MAARNKTQQSATPRDPRPVRAAIRMVLPYLIIPALVLLGVEYKVREWRWQEQYDWGGMDKVAGSKPIEKVFIGTSRTLYGIDQDVFAQGVGAATGRAPYVVNMGSGGTRLMYSYFGLRNLLERSPAQTQRLDLFIECPGGMPMYNTWNDIWFYPTMEGAIVPHLRWSDMGRLWSSSMTREEKLDLTVRFIGFSSVIFTKRGTVRAIFLLRGIAAVNSAYMLIAPERTKAVLDEGKGADMRTGQGPDMDVVRNEDYFFNIWKSQDKWNLDREWRDWDKTILADLIDMVRANGGRVYFYHIPQTERQEAYFAERVEDLAAFRAQAAKWGTPYLHSDFAYSDEDFPDRFHLGKQASVEYTKALVEEYLKAK